MINMQNNMKMVLMINCMILITTVPSIPRPIPLATPPHPGLNSKLIIVNPVPIKSLTHLTKISQLSSNAVHLQLP